MNKGFLGGVAAFLTIVLEVGAGLVVSTFGFFWDFFPLFLG